MNWHHGLGGLLLLLAVVNVQQMWVNRHNGTKKWAWNMTMAVITAVLGIAHLAVA